MNEAKYPSKERVERDGVLIHAEGDDLIGDPEEAKRQGYTIDESASPEPRVATERIERDGVLVAAEGDPLPDDFDEPPSVEKVAEPSKPSPAKRAAKKS